MYEIRFALFTQSFRRREKKKRLQGRCADLCHTVLEPVHKAGRPAHEMLSFASCPVILQIRVFTRTMEE